MRKLIVQQWVTVDNIAAEEDGGLSFVSGEPFSETTNPAFKPRFWQLVPGVNRPRAVTVVDITRLHAEAQASSITKSE